MIGQICLVTGATIRRRSHASFSWDEFTFIPGGIIRIDGGLTVTSG